MNRQADGIEKNVKEMLQKKKERTYKMELSDE